MFKLAEALKDCLEENFRRLVEGHADVPLLFTYESDGTPIRTRIRHSVRLGKAVIQRSGRQAIDYLIQRCCVSAHPRSDERDQVTLLRDPAPRG